MIIFITGATSGFGKATAEKFASQGFDLILNGRREDRLEELCRRLEKKYNIASITLPFDVGNRKEVQSAIDSLPDAWKKIDILFNNAGLALGRDYFDEANLDDWDTMVDTNVKGFAYVARAVSALMVAQKKGHIINMGSVAGKQVYEKGNMYCASKYAVDALNQAMRIDLLRHNIRVTGIHPGAAETEFSLVRFKGDESTANSIYNGLKPLSAEDVADAIWYCASVPSHVCINDLVITCTQQADAIYFSRTKA
ncbi:MAG: SDR family NAD(P)-dependent oxidoreductase [Chitinophagaceae bacterium]|nr:SDR family NAD(P)-dependent oxidoreductase [Chitinophagaceae bacterium]